MFKEYVLKYDKYPRSYSDLRKSTPNMHILIEKDYLFYNPKIKFKIIEKGNDRLEVTFYECGYDGIDDNLRKVIKSSWSIFVPIVRGDFFIDKKSYHKRELKLTSASSWP